MAAAGAVAATAGRRDGARGREPGAAAGGRSCLCLGLSSEGGIPGAAAAARGSRRFRAAAAAISSAALGPAAAAAAPPGVLAAANGLIDGH